MSPILLYELFAALACLPLAFTFRRTGLAVWPTVFVFIPLVGFPIAVSFLAFPQWPVLPQKLKKKTR